MYFHSAYMGPDMMKIPYGRDNQNQANVTSAKYYLVHV